MAGRLQEIFELVIGLDRSERDRCLTDACDGDAALRDEVEALLRAHDGAAKFLASPTAGSLADAMPTADFSALATTMAAPPRESPGTRIGPYKLLQLIGEGGFGSVFMAEQEPSSGPRPSSSEPAPTSAPPRRKRRNGRRRSAAINSSG
jgi:eukaryotic-like serine/threonine-protein kinase